MARRVRLIPPPTTTFVKQYDGVACNICEEEIIHNNRVGYGYIITPLECGPNDGELEAGATLADICHECYVNKIRSLFKIGPRGEVVVK